MGTIGIVVLSLLGGLFLAILIGAVVFLIWVCLRLHHSVQSTQADFSALVLKHHSQVDQFQSHIKSILDAHAMVVNTAVSRINGESLETASKSILSAANRIEKACVAFGELAKFLLADRDTITSNGANLPPDAYAEPEPGEQFVTRSPTAEADALAAFDEG